MRVGETSLKFELEFNDATESLKSRVMVSWPHRNGTSAAAHTKGYLGS